MKQTASKIAELDQLKLLINQNNLKASDFTNLEQVFQDLYLQTPPDKAPDLTQKIHQLLGESNNQHTLYGFAFRKPHGYAGDFEIIDKTYRQEVHPETPFAAWDQFFHSIAAAKAVRNRKTYFKQLIQRKRKIGKPLRVLNLASGPGRDLYEFFSETGDKDVSFDCVEMDQNAIAFARKLNAPYLANIKFIHQNIFRFQPRQKYDLIWSAGLFDYFTDEVFVKLLARMKTWIHPDAEIVIGNFSERNPSQGFMILLTDWSLNLRSAEKLMTLAHEAGFDAHDVSVGCEAERVNLFLHLQQT